jgi:ABC-type dipeptide/oligopeptide/nickel transport system ATPase component
MPKDLMTIRPAKPAHHRLLWVQVVGGFLDGLRMEFVPGLNCVIGGRGAGKTTVLELLRYALDDLPDDKDARKRIESLVMKNLEFGRIEVGIATKENMTYIVSRSPGEDAVVLTEQRESTDLTLRSGTLFKADVFSQNEVESIADRSDSQLALIDSFAQGEISHLTAEIRQTVNLLRGNAGAITPLISKIATLQEELKELGVIDSQVKGLSAVTGADAQVLNEQHAAKSLRDREKRAVDGLPTMLKEYGQLLNEQIGRLVQGAHHAMSKDMLAGPNHAVFQEIMRDMEVSGQQVDALLRQAMEVLRPLWIRLDAQTKHLTKAHGDQEMAFRALIEKQQAAMGDATKRAALEKRRNDLLVKKQDLEATQAQVDALQRARITLLMQMADLRLARFNRRQQLAERITAGIDGDIRVSVKQDGNPSEYRTKLDELLYRSKVQETSKTAIVESLFPAQLVQIIRDKAVDTLVDKSGISGPTAEKVVSVLMASDQLPALETVELIDEPCIELRDVDQWKDSRDLSTGQKCTAILPILLMESEKPLIIDQPEDNLDNRYVSDKVVKTIRAVKDRRQLIFVTHNPNIPVLGDAGRIFVMDSTGKAGRLAKSGTVDECKHQILELLEGGKKAFKIRSERYGA